MKHLLSIADLSVDEVWQILNLARELKEEWWKGGNRPILRGKTLGMIFQKPSLRTRVSFEMGMIHLGGQALFDQAENRMHAQKAILALLMS